MIKKNFIVAFTSVMQHFLTRQDVQPKIPHSYHKEYMASVKVSNNHSTLFKFISAKKTEFYMCKKTAPTVLESNIVLF